MSEAREIKNKLYEQFARLGQALSSPKRLELLDLLCQSEKTVETLAAHGSMTIANTSRHLQILRSAHLVDARKDRTFVYYRLADSKVGCFLGSLRKLAEVRLTEVDKIIADYFESGDRLEAVDRKRLLKRAKSGEVVILDVRPADEYAAAHIPYARSLPLKELKTRLKELSPEQEIVAYCRGPYCVLAQEAVTYLKNRGFKAARLGDGVTEWRNAGMPTETGA